MDRMVAWNDRATATNPKITKRPGTLPQPMSQPRSIEAPAFADVSGSPYPCPKGLKSIASLIKKSGSDKYKNHRYDHYYERWFREIRCKPKIKVIEIGANQGHSLNAWDTIFTSPGKTVLGLAYGGPAMGVEKKVRRGVGVLFGDQSKKKTMEFNRTWALGYHHRRWFACALPHGFLLLLPVESCGSWWSLCH